MPDARFGETVKIEKQTKNSKLIWEIIKWLTKKWYKLTDEKVKNYVDDLIKKLVNKKFDQAKKDWKPVFDNDKPILEKRLYNEYIKLSNKIEEIKKNWKESKVK